MSSVLEINSNCSKFTRVTITTHKLSVCLELAKNSSRYAFCISYVSHKDTINECLYYVRLVTTCTTCAYDYCNANGVAVPVLKLCSKFITFWYPFLCNPDNIIGNVFWFAFSAKMTEN